MGSTISPARFSPSPTQSLTVALSCSTACLLSRPLRPSHPLFIPCRHAHADHLSPSHSLSLSAFRLCRRTHVHATRTHPYARLRTTSLTHALTHPRARAPTQAPTHNLSMTLAGRQAEGGGGPPLTHSPRRPPLTHSQLAEGRTLTHSLAEAGGTPPLTHSPQSPSPLHTPAS